MGVESEWELTPSGAAGWGDSVCATLHAPVLVRAGSHKRQAPHVGGATAGPASHAPTPRGPAGPTGSAYARATT